MQWKRVSKCTEIIHGYQWKKMSLPCFCPTIHLYFTFPLSFPILNALHYTNCFIRRYLIWQSFSHSFFSRCYKFYFGYSFVALLSTHIFFACAAYSSAITLERQSYIVKRCQFLHLFEWFRSSNGFSLLALDTNAKWHYFYDFAPPKNCNDRFFSNVFQMLYGVKSKEAT